MKMRLPRPGDKKTRECPPSRVPFPGSCSMMFSGRCPRQSNAAVPLTSPSSFVMFMSHPPGQNA